MQTVLLAAVTRSEYRIPADLLPTGPFLQGLLLAVPESDSYAHLDLLVKAAADSKVVSHRAVLACKVMKAVAEMQDFATVFEETKCVMLVKRTLMALTAVDTLGNALRERVVEAVGNGIRCVLEKAKAAGSFQELAVTLREKCVLLGEKTLNRLSPMAARFLAGENTPNSAEITAEVAVIAGSNPLLTAFLYLRLLDLANSSESSHSRECLQAAQSLFSSKQLERLSDSLPKAVISVAPPSAGAVIDQFRRIYAQVRSDVHNGTHVDADKIASDLSGIAGNEGDKRAIWETAISMMKAEEAGKEPGLVWKLVLFGMHKLMLYTGKQWFELNDTLNRKFGNSRQNGWKKVGTNAEPREESKAAKEEARTSQPVPSTPSGSKKQQRYRRKVTETPQPTNTKK